ncbi:hypothetical protein AB4559_09345 [Vibrio sp. 10N.222.51.C8]|jgi:hypothetical protein|uniref:hypothetical protein n=1 Tax=Vibrio TaxID=662 RepID=UPI000C81F83C|nr:hypothetical protein [Vibrio splendidus]PMP01912.1 hypothetical protein BCS97_23840 [Vibrio splendidus]PMP33948.1 hypothetical protein BCS89_23270 [Vibrio splendidus]PMP35824.1 hypothetical protein BCS88_08135 [Vibrio splendidus]PMP36983.1 hypothetical protein BCS87_02565 [Vibrio splendidus]PMP54412.1 hypothetical protein BCS85_22555 [Vibrio splendidus]
MKFKVISTLSNENDIELDVVPRIGESVEGCEVLGVNYLTDSDYVAELKLKTIPDTVPYTPIGQPVSSRTKKIGN